MNLRGTLNPSLCATLPPHDNCHLSMQNTSGDIYVPEGGSDPEVSGSPTEAAILKFALAIKADFKAVRESGKQLKTEPFSSAKKRMGVLVEKDGRARAHWKGASEIVLGQCDRSIDKTGKPVKLTKETRDGLLKVIDDMAKSSLRTLAIAYREVSSPGGGDIPDDKLVCLAIVGIKDPPRPGVKESIKLCHNAGIIVRMVTGDNLTTAQAISKEIGILDHGGEVVEGPKFRNMSEEQMRDLVPRLRVMARSSPTDKNLLVKHLRANGEVVAATGDGELFWSSVCCANLETSDCG
jgi:Ca2+-transporting ATPase